MTRDDLPARIELAISSATLNAHDVLDQECTVAAESTARQVLRAAEEDRAELTWACHRAGPQPEAIFRKIAARYGVSVDE